MNMIRLPDDGSFDLINLGDQIDIPLLINCFEYAIFQQPDHFTEVPIRHYFSNNVYAREMKLKATSLITGRVYRDENLCILSEGEASVLSIDGAMRIKAPFTYVASKGSKRLIYAHTDLTWTTILGTGDKNVDKIMKEFCES